MKNQTPRREDGFDLDPASTHAILSFMLCHWMPRVMNAEAAAQMHLRIAWVFTGAGGGTWTMHVADGKTTVREEPMPEVEGHFEKQTLPATDLTFTQTPDAFFRTLHLWLDPMFGLLTGEIKVQGVEHLRQLNGLFPDPRTEQELEQVE